MPGIPVGDRGLCWFTGVVESLSLRSSPGRRVACSARWVEYPYATRVPERDRWVEHRLVWRIEADHTICAVAVFDSGDEARWAKSRARPRTDWVEVTLGVSRAREPDAWPEWPIPPVTDVGVGLSAQGGGGGVGGTCVDGELWATAPRELLWRDEPTITTGALVELGRLPDAGVSVRVVVLAPDEVSYGRRWRADPEVLDRLPPDLEFLTRGGRGRGEISSAA